MAESTKQGKRMVVRCTSEFREASDFYRFWVKEGCVLITQQELHSLLQTAHEADLLLVYEESMTLPNKEPM